MKRQLLIASLMLTACGQTPATSSVKDSTNTPAPAVTSLCEAYAKSEDWSAIKVVNPLNESVTDTEKAMIQTAVLTTDQSPVSPEEAVNIFSDKENDGSLGGDISYYNVTMDGKVKTIASAVYYPGDNEYGALFQIWTTQDGSQFASLIGTVGDGDVSCLSYVD